MLGIRPNMRYKMYKRLVNRVFSLCLFSCLISTSGYAAQEGNKIIIPKAFDTSYELTMGVLTLGEMNRKLYFDNEKGRYVYTSSSKPTGYAKWMTSSTIDETSEWIFNGKRLRPLNYSYHRTEGAFNKEKEVEVKFDWENNNALSVMNGNPITFKLPGNSVDALLYHLAVTYDLKIGRKDLGYNVANGKRVKLHRFERVGEEDIETAMGTFKTIKIKLPGKRETIIWCAPELDYLPVQLEQHESRGKLLMKLTSAQIGDDIRP